MTTKTTLDGLPFKLGTKPSAPLAQGAHVLRVQATDAAGNVTVKHARILVNTSEKLGTNALIAGAVGKDVKQLQHVAGHRRAAEEGRRHRVLRPAHHRRRQVVPGVPRACRSPVRPT